MQKIVNPTTDIGKSNQSAYQAFRLTPNIFSGLLLILLLSISSFGQAAQHTENKADQTLRGSGRVNPSTLGMEIDIPLGSYPGRGINVPISLSYSSKLWRIEYTGSAPGGIVTGGCRAINHAEYSENAAAGWTTSLAVPYVEYTGKDNLFDSNGFPWGVDASLCDPGGPPSNTENAYLRRLAIHLPGGETHELRADDTVEIYPPWSNCIPPTNQSCASNDPSLQHNWNRTYYAVDGSNIKYVEDSDSNTYRLLMPDGSFYDFAGTISSMNLATARKAVKFTDRNGNYTGYNDQTGVWTDTLGKPLTAPIGAAAPAAPTVNSYTMPGTTGSYKFHWKQLKGNSAADSALSDFGQILRYRGSKYPSGSTGNWATQPAGTYLFGSHTDSYVVRQEIFNPVVLTEIELPTGQSYKFTYDIYGRIERIYYPTGGEERFVYSVIAPLAASPQTNVSDQANFGVTNRKLYPTAGQGAPYEWSYGVSHVAPSGYKVSVTAPDGTISQRVLHRANSLCPGCGMGTFGYDNGLAGMPYEELGFAANGQLVSRKLTSWTLTTLPGWANTGSGGYYFGHSGDWHPRVVQEETTVYDAGGNGVSATVKYEYEGNLSLRETPVLTNKTTQYAFVPIIAESERSGTNFQPDDLPDANPTPVPNATSSLTPVKIFESTYLINDANVEQWRKDIYKSQNMVGLTSISVVTDGAGTVVSRSETGYDDDYYSPGIRGNPTSARAWDSTKGGWDNPSAYIQTRAKFDSYGNQYESIDAKGNATTTEYDATHHAFPIKVTTAVPDPTGQNGSNAAFESAATFNFTTGLPQTTTDANGLETRIEYDPATLRPLRAKNYSANVLVGSQSETVYHDEPNNYWVKSRTQIDTNKWAERIAYYDGLGRAYKSEQIDSQGNVFVEKEFDAEGRVKRVTNPFRTGEAKHWTTNVYDEASRIKEIVLPDASKVLTDYGVSVAGVVGVTKQITDQAGKKRRGVTDALGRMVRVIEDPTGQNLNTDYVFDTLGNLRKTVQGGQSRYFSYDSLGRLLRAKQPEQEINQNLALAVADAITGHNQWSVGYAYDDNGNIVTTTDARNVSVTGSYDNFNRLRFRDYSDATPDVSFFYDGTGLGAVPLYSNGKTTRVASSVSETRFTSFDNLGRLKTHQQITDGQTYPTAYSYNLSGAITEETYPSGRVVRSVLNQDGELAMLQSKKNPSAGFVDYASDFTYSSAGAVEKMRLGNGRWETVAYNNRLQVTQIGLGTISTEQNLLKLEYSYGTATENNGSLREQKITAPTVGATAGFTAVQSYVYDDLNRLKSAAEITNGNQTPSWKQTFTYDQFGNRRFDAANTTTIAVSNNVTNPEINTSDNRFSDGQNYLYDKAGNLTQDAGGKQFLYDAENHQKEVKNEFGATVGVYHYDGDGRRVKKVSATETVVFVYDAGGQLVAEYSTAVSQTPQVSYLTQDHLGSPRVITDQNGNVTTRSDYTAFGEQVVSAERAIGLGYDYQSETRKGYTGYEKDTESGLEFAQARYYNTSHGRFTSVDPLTASASIKNPQTFNRYSYVLNSPYKFSDPLGLLPMSSYSGGGFCSASQSSCEEGEELTTSSIESYQERQQDKRNQPKPKNNKKAQGKSQPKQKTPSPPPPVVDVRKDKTITAGIAKIKAGAKPLAEGETPELSGVEVIVGDTTVLQNGTFVDMYGNPTDNFSGLIRPVAYVPLDQGGNILINPSIGLEEDVTVLSGPKRETSTSVVTQAEGGGGVFIDIQSQELRQPSILTQNVTVSYFTQDVNTGVVQRNPSFSITGNKITLNPALKSVTVERGKISRVP